VHENIFRDTLLLFGYCVLIFYVSHQPSLPIAMTFLHQDKLMHAGTYAVLAILAWRSFNHQSTMQPKGVLISAFIFTSSYGLSDEFHQSFIIGRDADAWDWLADSVGALLALVWIKYKTGAEFKPKWMKT